MCKKLLPPPPPKEIYTPPPKTAEKISPLKLWQFNIHHQSHNFREGDSHIICHCLPPTKLELESFFR